MYSFEELKEKNKQTLNEKAEQKLHEQGLGEVN